MDAGAPDVRDAGSNMTVPDAATADAGTGATGGTGGSGGSGGSGGPLNCGVDVADCNRDPRDGCEESLTSPAHCGRCDNACAAPNASAGCVNRQCAPLTCSAGFADCNNNRVDGCETALNLDSSCGSCERRCVSPTPYCGLAGVVRTCVNPAQALNDQRVELACLVPMTSPAYCGSIAPAGTVCPVTGRVVRRTFTVGGRAGTIYNVTFRIRGVVEPKVYAGGRGPGEHFYIGGTPTATNYNSYRLQVSSPAQTYFLNYDEARGESPYVFPLDHTKVIPVAAGATVNLEISDPDCVLITNCQAAPPAACVPYVVPGIPPAPAGFNGQFVHIDVVAVAVGP